VVKVEIAPGDLVILATLKRLIFDFAKMPFSAKRIYSLRNPQISF
jgi:hypothetical protein